MTTVEPLFIASLKVKTTAAEGETPLAKFAGTVEPMVGAARADDRSHNVQVRNRIPRK